MPACRFRSGMGANSKASRFEGQMQQLLAGLRAAGEGTRLRLLFLLSRGEFNVSELTQILGQSQPRVSRHLKLMVEAGLLDRFKEGSWVLFRMREDGKAAEVASSIVALIPETDTEVRRDISRAEEILSARRELAASYFGANAKNWNQIRSLHISEQQVEAAILELLGDQKVAGLLDIGTGTGRILELLAPLADQATGIDASREMLSIAREQIAQAGLKNVQVRQGDIYSLPDEENSIDLITIHQVLHFLDNPGGALEEAAKVLAENGRMLIIDFSPHELEFLREKHAHRRLGIDHKDVQKWCERAGLVVRRHESLAPPESHKTDGLTVSLWLLEKPASEH